MRILRNAGIERSTLVVTSQSDRTVIASIRNLPKTKALPAAYLNVVDMLNHQGILITEEAVRVAEQLWGQKAAPSAAPAKAPARRAKAAKEEPKAEAEAIAEAPAAPIEVATETPKRARASRAAPTIEKPAQKADKPAAKAAKPGATAKPSRAARKPKAEASGTADKPAPKRRTRKTAGGEK
jgi:hypothetical protein